MGYFAYAIGNSLDASNCFHVSHYLEGDRCYYIASRCRKLIEANMQPTAEKRLSSASEIRSFRRPENNDEVSEISMIGQLLIATFSDGTKHPGDLEPMRILLGGKMR